MLGPSFFLKMMVQSGIGFGYVAPFSMVPYTIEVHAVRSGKRNEGAFYGKGLFTSKIGQAVSWLLTGLVLALGHYVANAAQAVPVRLAIRVFVGPLPTMFLLGAMFLIQFYLLDEKTCATILVEGDRPAGRS